MMAVSVPAGAGPFIVNGGFEDIGSATHSFAINYPTSLPGWNTSTTPSGNKILDCLVVTTDTTNLCGTVAFGGGFKFWVNPGASPLGGNFVAIDGDATYENALQQTLTGLTIGAEYVVSFYQAAAQQSGFNGATTEQWQVSFGSQTKTSALMNTPNHGMVAWNFQSLRFQATAASAVLSFFALGTPSGQPPFVLLDGVDVNLVTPEPGSFVLLGLGLLAIPFGRKFRRKK